MKFNITKIIALIALIAGMQSNSYSQILYSNLGQPVVQPFDFYSNFDSFYPSLASSFETGAAKTKITSLTALMSGTLTPTTVTASIYSSGLNSIGNASAPASLVGSFNPTTVVGNIASPWSLYTFDSSGISLQASTSYWMILSVTRGELIHWTGTNSNNLDSGSVFSNIIGSGYEQFGSYDGSWHGPYNGHVLFSLSGTSDAAPEPSSFALGGIAMLILIILGRRRCLRSYRG